MERDLQRPLRPHVPADPLIAPGPGARARAEARRGLYVHVPFCAVRCTYCHFSTGALSAAALERWFAALEREAALRAPLADGTAFTSVFLGGGSPSALSSRHVARIARVIRDHFTIAPGAEFTLEANPEGVRPALLDAWAAMGVNRLSMGVQSFEPAELRVLGRIHDRQRPLDALADARAHGFTRLSFDLMFGFPGHTTDAFERTLDRVMAHAPEHLSAYAFIPERGTPLGDAVLDGAAPLPDDETQALLWSRWLERSAAEGLVPYETSNVSRPDAEARHNLTYWLRREYMALGPSAHGLWRGERWGNHYALADWADALERGAAPEAEREVQTPDSVADEIVLLGLRLASGIVAADYPAVEWTWVEERYREGFAEAERLGRLEGTSEGWKLPAAHGFVADDTIAWLAARAARVDTTGGASLNSRPCRSLLSPAA